MEQDTAEVGLAFVDLATGDSLWIGGAHRFHAASTMKVPVLIELARRIDGGEFSWEDSLSIINQFTSLADGSSYALDLADDSDSTLYAIQGRRVPLSMLAKLMIVRSSNLAANLLIQRLDARRIDGTAHALGADSIHVLRGVEDSKAYALGMNNTTTPRDLAVLLRAIAEGRAASALATEKMLSFLLGQEFNEGIPAGLPPGIPVAHKTGWFTGVSHDAALVYPPGRKPYVLVILTRGYGDPKDATRLMGDISRIVWKAVSGER